MADEWKLLFTETVSLLEETAEGFWTQLSISQKEEMKEFARIASEAVIGLATGQGDRAIHEEMLRAVESRLRSRAELVAHEAAVRLGQAIAMALGGILRGGISILSGGVIPLPMP